METWAACIWQIAYIELYLLPINDENKSSSLKPEKTSSPKRMFRKPSEQVV